MTSADSVEKYDIFFATSFSGHVDYDNDNKVHNDFRERIERILESLRKIGGFTVYCAVEAEGWRVADREPGATVLANEEKINASESMLVLIDEKGSDGRGQEFEYARLTGKSIFLATGPEERPGFIMKDNIALGRAEHIPYDDPDELARELVMRLADNT